MLPRPPPSSGVPVRHRVVEEAVPPSSDIQWRTTERALRQEISACAQAHAIVAQAQAGLRSDLDALDTISVEQGAAIERASQLAASTTLIGELAVDARALAQTAHGRIDEVWSNVVVTVDRLRDIRTDVLERANTLVTTACTAAHADLANTIVETIDLSMPPRIEQALNARAAAWTAMATSASLEAFPFPVAATAVRRPDPDDRRHPAQGCAQPGRRPDATAAPPQPPPHNRHRTTATERVPSAAGSLATVLSRAAEARLSANVLRDARTLVLDLLLDIDTSRLRDSGGMLLSRDNIKRLGITTDDLVEGSYRFYSTIVALRDVRANLDVRELADAGQLTVSRANMVRQGIRTDDIAEGSSNGYYTEARFDRSYARADERNQGIHSHHASSSLAPHRATHLMPAPTPPGTRSSDDPWAVTARSQMVVRRDDAVDRPPMHVQTRGIEVRLDALVGETRRRLAALDGNVAAVLSHAAVVALRLTTGEDVIEGAAGPFATRLRTQAAVASRTPTGVPSHHHHGARPVIGQQRLLPATTAAAIARRAVVDAARDTVDARRFDRLVQVIPPTTTSGYRADAIAPLAHHARRTSREQHPPTPPQPQQPPVRRPSICDAVTACKGRVATERRVAAVVPFARKPPEPPPRLASTDRQPLASPRAVRSHEEAMLPVASLAHRRPALDMPPPSRDTTLRATRGGDAAPELTTRHMAGSSRVRARDTVGERDDNLRLAQARSQALGEVVRRLGLTMGETEQAFAQLDATLTTRVAFAVQTAESTRSKMDAVDAVVASIETTVQTLAQQDAAFELRIATVDANVTGVESSVIELDARAVAEAVRVTSLYAELDALAETIALSNVAITAVARRVDAHMVLPAQVAVLQTTARASAERIVELGTAQLDAVGRLDDIEGIVRAHTASIANTHLETAIAAVRATTLVHAADLSSLRADVDAGIAGANSNVARLMAHDIVLDDSIIRVDAELGSATGRIHVLEVGARAALARDHATLVDVTELFDTTAVHLARLDTQAQGLDAIERVVGRTVERQDKLIDEVTLARTVGGRRHDTREGTPLSIPPPRTAVAAASPRTPPPLHVAVEPRRRRSLESDAIMTLKASSLRAPREEPTLPFKGTPTGRPAASLPPPPGGRERHRPELPARVEVVGYEWSLVQHGIGDLTLRARSPSGTPVAQSVRVVFGDNDVVESPMVVVGAEATTTVVRRRLTRASAMMELRAVSSAGISRATHFEPSYGAAFVDLVDLSTSTSFVARVGRDVEGLGGVAVVRDGRLYHHAAAPEASTSYVVFSLGMMQRAHAITLEFPRAAAFCAQARNGGRGGIWLNPAGRGWLDACAWWVRAFGETPIRDGDPCLLRCDSDHMSCTFGLAQTNPDGFTGELMIAMAFANVEGGWCIPRVVPRH